MFIGKDVFFMKKLIVLLLTMTLLMTSVMGAFAKNMVTNDKKDDIQFSKKELLEMKEAFSPENLAKARKKVDFNKIGKQVIKLSDNYQLECEITKTYDVPVLQNNHNLKARPERHCGTTYTEGGKNVMGKKVWEFFLDGSFVYDGEKVRCVTHKAYGKTYALGWSCGFFSSNKAQIASTLCRAEGSGHYDFQVGVDPIAMPVKSFEVTGYIYCDENGNMKIK